MKTTSERLGNGLAKMTVEVSPEEVQEEYVRAAARISNRAKIPGFRPGKAPRALIERMFGKQAILGDAVEHLVPQAYDRAVVEEKLDPIDQPELDLQEVEIDKALVFTATIPLAPTVELGDPGSISLTRSPVVVQESEIDEVIAQLRQSRSTLGEVEGRRLQEKDVAQMRVSVVAGEVERVRDDPYQLVIGEHWFPRGFDSNVLGMEVGDLRVFQLDIPDDYFDAELRGKFATFAVELIAIREAILPELDDAFASSVSAFSNVVELRADVRVKVEENKRRQGENELKEAALDSLVARSTFEIPDALVRRRTDEIVESRNRFVTSQGVALETYLGSTGKTAEDWRNDAKDAAVAEIRRAVALHEFGKSRSIEVSPGEVDEETEAIVMRYRESERAWVRKAYEAAERRAHVEHTLSDRKALDAVLEAVTVTEEASTGEGTEGAPPAGPAGGGVEESPVSIETERG